MNDRQANLAKIHIGKKELGMGEVDYRALLKKLTGKDSAGVMDPREHGQVIRAMEGLGFQPGIPTSTRKSTWDGSIREESPVATDRPTYIRLIQRLWHQVSRANNEALALRRRLFKFNHKTELEQLSLEELKEVYEDLQRASCGWRHQW